MDAKSATPPSVIILGILCVVVAATVLVWQSWDMFGARNRSMLQGWDDSFYYFWLPSVVIDHDVDFSNQLSQSDAFTPETRRFALAQPRTAAGLIPNKYPPGWALGSLPFFLLAHAVAPEGSTGLEPLYVIAVWSGQLLYAGVGLCLAANILRRYFSAKVAWVAVLAGWLASPLVYYQTVRLSMSHSQVFVLGLAAFWLALRIADGDSRARHWAMLGFCAALLVVTRNVAIVYLLLPAFVMVQRLRSFSAAAWLGLGAVIPVVVQLAAWKGLYGSWLVYSYGDERFDFTRLHLAEVLFSPRHGWFYWHPLLFLGVAAFAGWAWRQTAGRPWLVSLCAIILLNSAWSTWWLGSSFGYRGLELADFFAMIGLACMLQAAQIRPWLRATLSFVVTSAIVWNLILLGLFLAGQISREESVTYGDALRALADWLASAR